MYRHKNNESLLVQIPHITFRYTPREELGAAKLFVGMAVNDVTVNNKGGATYNNTIQLLKTSCHKTDSNFAIIQPQKPWTQSLMPQSNNVSNLRNSKPSPVVDMLVDCVEYWPAN